MGRRRAATTSLLAVFVVLAAVLVSLPHLAESSGRHHHSDVQSRGHGGEEASASKGARERRQWPCCDSCGGCTKSIPSQCQCMDAARGGCHPACRDCVRSALSVHPPVYRCMDRIPDYCQRRCNAIAAN